MSAKTNYEPRCLKFLRISLRISLRLVFIVLTLLGIWLGVHLHGAKRQAQIVESIRQNGGSVHYYVSEQVERASRVSPALTRILGDDFFRKPAVVSFQGKQVTDRVLSGIARLPSLKALSFRDVSVTDSGLMKLSTLGMDELSYLHCYRDARNELVFQELSKDTHWDWLGSNLHALRDELADFHSIKVRLDKAEIERAGVDEFSAVLSYSKKGVPLGVGLEDSLGQHKLGWVVKGGELLVTSKAKAVSNRQAANRIRENMPALNQLESTGAMEDFNYLVQASS